MIGLDRASVRFGSRLVLDALSFTVEPGHCAAILGPNGRGKTTALRAILGLQPLDAGRRTAPAIVGYVPQHSSGPQAYQVRDIVVMGRATRLGLFGQPDAQDYKVADEALDRVGAQLLSSARFDLLSGGERQLVLLARALATGSEVLVLDEPGAALDLANQSRLLTLLDTLRRERRHTIVFTTHDPNHALAVADHALLMMPDGTTRFGPVDDMIAPAPLEELYEVAMRVVEVEGVDGVGHRAVLPAFSGQRAA